MANVNDWQWVLRKKAKLGLALAVWLGTSSGWAQQKATAVVREKPTPSIEARVEKLYNQGVAAANRQDWANAEKYFEEALTLGKIPQIAANLGHAELRLGKAREAAEHFEQFLRDDKEAEKEAREEIEGLFAQARTRTVTVYVTTNVDGTDVFINNELYGKSPLTQRIFLEPGSYTFVGEKDGFKAYRHSMDLSVGSTVNVKMEMDASLPIQTVGAKKERIDMSDPRVPWVVGAGIVATAGLGIGTGLSIAGYLKGQDIEREETSIEKSTPGGQGACKADNMFMNRINCDNLPGLREAKRALDIASVPAYVVAGASVTAGLIILFRPPQSLRTGNVVPMIGPAYQGFVVSGSF